MTERNNSPDKGLPLERLLTWLCLALLGIAYVLVGLRYIGLHVYLGETDTSAFFRYTAEVVDHGGAFGTIRSLFNGSFTASNQHPLFPLIISLFFERTVDYFINIKILNFILGLIFIYLVYWLISREFNRKYGLVAAALLVANDVFMHQTTMVACETLLVIFTSLSFYFLIKGIDDNRFWIPAGICAGLAYMTKASGMFIVFGFGLYLLYDCRLRFWKLLKNRYLWAFILLFVVIALPLLVRNTIVYKFPFYNYNVNILAMDENWGKAEKQAKFRDILKKDPGENALRFVKGIEREFRVLIFSLYSFSLHYVEWEDEDTAGWARKAAGAGLAVIMLVLSVVGFIRSGIDKRKKWLIAFLVIGFYIPLSWYSITSPNRRYIMPVSFFFLVFLASFSVDMIKILHHRVKEAFPGLGHGGFDRVFLYGFIVLFLLFNSAYLFAKKIPDPKKSVRIEDDYHELAALLGKGLKKDEVVAALGWNHYSFVLLYPEIEERKAGLRYFKTMNDFTAHMNARRNIRYILMQAKLYRLTKNIFSDYIGRDREKGFIIKKDIPGWKAVKMDGNPPAEYILYERR